MFSSLVFYNGTGRISLQGTGRIISTVEPWAVRVLNVVELATLSEKNPLRMSEENKSEFFKGHDPTRRSVQNVVKVSRATSGPVKRCRNLTGRAGSP